VSLDPSNPAHVEAIRWACGDREEPPPNHHASFALAAVQEPSLSASLLRALLQRCGVRVLGFEETSSFAFASVEPLGDGLAPTLLLSLLDIPADAHDRREMAMAALKEAGR
jgi:hypothetical protein